MKTRLMPALLLLAVAAGGGCGSDAVEPAGPDAAQTTADAAQTAPDAAPADAAPPDAMPPPPDAAPEPPDAAPGPPDAAPEPPDAAGPDAMADPHLVTVELTGSGGGKVTSTPAGINCPGTCTMMFPAAQTVTLRAAPAGGSALTGWSGACSGSGNCVLDFSAGGEVTADFGDLSGGHNFVFLSTGAIDPSSLADLGEADDVCAADAAAAGLPGDYVAWLSTPTTSAKSRLGSSRGWVRTDGRPVADTVADLTAGKLYHSISITASGQPSAGLAATGTRPDGSHAVDLSCSGWKSSSGTYVSGFSDYSTQGWTDAEAHRPCNQTNPPPRLYCFGVGRTAALAAPSATGRIVFVTSGTVSLASGIDAYDAKCAAEAMTNHLAGTYKALIAPLGKTAASRFVKDARTWVRPDGVVPVGPPGLLMSSSSVIAPINVTAAKGYLGQELVATGAGFVGDFGLAGKTCGGWASTSAGSSVIFGTASLRAPFFGAGESTCEVGPVHLFCVQE